MNYESLTNDYHSDNGFFIRFLMYYFKIFGNASVRLKTAPINHKNSTQWFFGYSRIGNLYNILLGILIIGVILYYRGKPMEEVEKEFSIVGSLIMKGYVVLVSSILLILLKFAIRRDDIFLLRDKFDVINQYVRVNPIAKKNAAIVILTFTLNLVNIMGVKCYNDFNLYSKDQPISVFLLVGTFFYFLFEAIISAVLMQFAVLLEIVDSYLKMMNRGVISMMDHFHLSEIRDASGLRVNLNFRKFMDMHGFLYDLSRELSLYYSLPLLLCITIVFVYSTIILFLMMESIISTNKFNWSLAIQMCFIICPLFLITTRVSAILNESEKTKKIITDNLKDANNSELEKKLRLFLDCVSHEELKFKVYDYFSLDQSLMTSFVGTLVTYLVVLLQFFSFNNKLENEISEENKTEVRS